MDFLVSTEDSTKELMMWKQPKKTHVYKRGRLPRSVAYAKFTDKRTENQT